MSEKKKGSYINTVFEKCEAILDVHKFNSFPA